MTFPKIDPPAVTPLIAPRGYGGGAPGRPDGALTSRAGRPGNIVPFVRPRGGAGQALAPATAEDRPAPIAAERTWWQAPILLGSLGVHAAVLAMFLREPPAAASIGVEVVSVELVLGTNVAAGLAETPTQSDAPVNAAASQDDGLEICKEEAAKPLDATPEPVPEPPPVPVLEPQPEPVRETQALPLETAPPETPAEEVQKSDPVTTSTVAPAEPDPTPTAEAKARLDPEAPVAREAEPEPAPAVATPEPPADKTSKPDQPAPVQTRPAAAEEPRREAPKTKPAAKRPQRQAAAKDKAADGKRTAAARNSAAAVASSGVGIGRSDASTNYRGLVAAHLARHKRFPEDARRAGQNGTVTVSFALDGGGRVTAVRLLKGSGAASIDAEAVAMVRRASPFPAPPSGNAMSFSVPVSFFLR